MARIKVSYTDEATGDFKTGWFDDESAEWWREDTSWDGNNSVGVISGIPKNFGGAYLYRTSGGRWVDNVDARNYFSGGNQYSFITDDQAREWLIRSGNHEDVLEKYFGAPEEESGPGRPTLGDGDTTAFTLRFPEELLARTDARAQVLKTTRAELIRRFVDAGLTASS